MIIEQNELPSNREPAIGAQHARKVGECAKPETTIERPKKIVLVAGQNVTWLERLDYFGKAGARIGQSHTENRQVDRTLNRGQCARASARFDVDALPPHFDQERERLPANPISDPPGWQDAQGPIIWDLAKNSVVLHGKYANDGAADAQPVAAGHRPAIASRRTHGADERDARPRSDQRGAMPGEEMRRVEEVVEVAMGDKDGIDRAGSENLPTDLGLRDGAKVERRPKESDPREIGIDQQRRFPRLEKIGISPEIGYPDRAG